MHTRYIDVDGMTVSYAYAEPARDSGGRPALSTGDLFVFVHDVGENARLWRPQLEILGAEHSALALDLPGHGKSSGPMGMSSVAEYARVLGGFVRAMALRPFVLVGKGLGASIALHYGATHTRQVRGLVLLGAAAKAPVRAETLAMLEDVVEGRIDAVFDPDDLSASTSPEVMRVVRTEQRKTDPRVRYMDMVAWAADDFRSRLTEIRQPVLVVAGADDRIVSPEASQDLCPQLPNARMEVIENAGHSAELEQADLVAAKISEFVRSLATTYG
jgi:3-oxoadipate enol-lactonase